MQTVQIFKLQFVFVIYNPSRNLFFFFTYLIKYTLDKNMFQINL